LSSLSCLGKPRPFTEYLNTMTTNSSNKVIWVFSRGYKRGCLFGNAFFEMLFSRCFFRDAFFEMLFSRCFFRDAFFEMLFFSLSCLGKPRPSQNVWTRWQPIETTKLFEVCSGGYKRGWLTWGRRPPRRNHRKNLSYLGISRVYSKNLWRWQLCSFREV
jgi:hypothetical protein